ncbi:MAG: NADH:ubiquinone reductase (Na(+)-transporting) subunit D [Phycisphaerales bacterium]|nr:MAG: NADH:ubiquinone reductase (Na(+)-transporting) subunit D [Phycisphaerales bacterium]
MADSQQLACGPCASQGLCGGKGLLTLKEGAWANNPLAIQMLGICSALAVTNRLENSLVMGGALIFVCVGSNLLVSLLRKVTPHRIRMIAEVAIIATFVILFDQFLKAFYWDMSKQLGPYVGLIITNCIVMGRAEAFALQNPPMLSIVDGIANGVGYAVVLGIIGFFRELLGAGEILGREIPGFSSWYTPNQLMILAPGAFFALGIVIGIFNAIKGPEPEENK